MMADNIQVIGKKESNMEKEFSFKLTKPKKKEFGKMEKIFNGYHDFL